MLSPRRVEPAVQAPHDYEEREEAQPDQESPWVCARCGSHDVQHAMWVELNGERVREEFGSWCGNLANSWCPECDTNVKIVRESELELQ